MTIAPNKPPSQPAKHGGPDTRQLKKPVCNCEIWDLIDRPDVQAFIAYVEHRARELERPLAYADGHRDGTNQEYARWQRIPLAQQSFSDGWHEAREYYERTGNVPPVRLRPVA